MKSLFSPPLSYLGLSSLLPLPTKGEYSSIKKKKKMTRLSSYLNLVKMCSFIFFLQKYLLQLHVCIVLVQYETFTLGFVFYFTRHAFIERMQVWCKRLTGIIFIPES